MSTIAPACYSDAEVVEQWLFGRSPNTQDYYKRYATRFLAFTGCTLAEVSLTDLQRFAASLDEQSLAKSGQRTILASVKSLLTFAVKLGHVQTNVSGALKMPKAKETLVERILPEADVLLMIRLEPNERDRLILKLTYAAGMRVSEVASLKRKDLQPRGDGGQVTVFGKGSKTRTILLPPSIWKELMSFSGSSEPESPLFAGKNGGHMTRARLHAIVANAAARLDLKASPHWLRHAHASHALDRGAPIHLVQATLGHSSVATTGKYLHAKPSESSATFLSL